MWIEKHGAKYRIRDMRNGKKTTIETGFPTKTVAKERKQRLEIEAIDLGPVKAGADKINFEAWAEEWWKGHARTLSPNTQRTEGGRFGKHIVGRLGHHAVKDIDDAVVRAWLNDLAEPDDADYEPLGAKSIKNIHGYLYMCMETAVRERLVRANPCGHSRLPRWEPRRPRFLSEKELSEVIAKIPAKWRPLAVFIAGTGCRAGEAIGLRQRRVDLLGGKVRFESQMRREGEQYVDVPLKTRASRRTVGIGASLVQVLLPLVEVDEESFVFRDAEGRPLQYHAFRQAWKKALLKSKYEGVHIHDLRHTHASLLIAKGRPLTSIQRRLGHSSIQVTSDVYGGLLPEVEDETAAAFEQVLSGIGLGGIMGEQDGSQRPTTAHDDSRGKEKPQVDGRITE